ncbi:MAG: CrcB family protein [Bacteroidota bacterium]|nr:CrcB family protein [Bacteroidota bacterium]
MNFLLVFIGGGIGCVLRYMIGLGFHRVTSSLPWATFVSNVVACTIFAIAMWFINGKVLLNQADAQSQTTLKLLILTGFCGGLSTFSTFGYETFLLFKQGLHMVAFLNIIFSTLVCLGIFYIFSRHTA